jgi:hypothetical protein
MPKTANTRRGFRRWNTDPQDQDLAMLRSPQPWCVPSLESGMTAPGYSMIGRYADSADVLHAHWNSDGAVNTLIAGGVCSGSTNLLHLLLAEEAASDRVVSWLIDPYGGTTLPEWAGRVNRVATRSDHIHKAFVDLERIVRDRAEWLSTVAWVDQRGRDRRGVSWREPSPEFPLISVTVEHAALALDSVFDLFERVVAMGRKTNVRFTVTTNTGPLSTLGRLSTHTIFRSGNVIALRGAHQTISESDLPTRSIPQWFADDLTTAGVGYALTSPRPDSVMRLDLVADPYEIASEVTEPTPLDWRAKRAING